MARDIEDRSSGVECCLSSVHSQRMTIFFWAMIWGPGICEDSSSSNLEWRDKSRKGVNGASREEQR